MEDCQKHLLIFKSADFGAIHERIQRGGLNIEVISEAGVWRAQPPERCFNTKIMPNARFRAYLSKF